MPLRTDGKPAPDELVIVHGFLNTCADELGIEDLATTDAATEWLRSAGLWTGDQALSAAALTELTGFRENLRQVVRENHVPEAATLVALEPYLKHVRLGLDVGTRGLELMSVQAGVAGVIGTLLVRIHNSMQQGTWSRFKCCQLPSCGWAFYDYSKNHSGRWCSMKTCGSRHKARTYLQRKNADS